MNWISCTIVSAFLIALVAPAIAELPSDAVAANQGNVSQMANLSIINPMDPGYVWGNPLAIVLSGVDPLIFENGAFRKDPGGMASGNPWTSSINDFREADANAGASNITKKAAKVGLVSWDG
ncbi:MAG: hypothetical protein HPY61_09085 [Methanotrichaceae archaeon]|nr:hypothetical protein [Methanotrichaceae archaeon]